MGFGWFCCRILGFQSFLTAPISGKAMKLLELVKGAMYSCLASWCHCSVVSVKKCTSDFIFKHTFLTPYVFLFCMIQKLRKFFKFVLHWLNIDSKSSIWAWTPSPLVSNGFELDTFIWYKSKGYREFVTPFFAHKCTIICYDPWIVSLSLHMRVRDHTCKGSVEVCPTFIKYNIQTYYISLGGLSTHCQLALSWIFLRKCME